VSPAQPAMPSKPSTSFPQPVSMPLMYDYRTISHSLLTVVIAYTTTSRNKMQHKQTDTQTAATTLPMPRPSQINYRPLIYRPQTGAFLKKAVTFLYVQSRCNGREEPVAVVVAITSKRHAPHHSLCCGYAVLHAYTHHYTTRFTHSKTYKLVTR